MSEEGSHYCPTCAAHVLARRETANHLLHLVVTFFLCGLWLPIWLFCAVSPGDWRCTRCGRVVENSPSGAGALLFLLVIGPLGLLGTCAILSHLPEKRLLERGPIVAAHGAPHSEPSPEARSGARIAPRRPGEGSPSRTLWHLRDRSADPAHGGARGLAVPCGAAVEVRERDGALVYVRASGGLSGWIDSADLEE